ncbi:MAG: APC family permease [Chloroflexota bacterium]
MTTETRELRKSLGGLDTLLFTICALLFVDTVASMSSMGASAVSWYVILVLLFFIPYGLITAELGSTYPDQGGLYVWVKRAFGETWAARTSWIYWVNMALWMPSSLIFVAGMISQLFFPDLNLMWIIAIGILSTWLIVGLGLLNLDESKWIVNLASVFKVILILAIIIAGVVYELQGNAPVNDLSFASIKPVWGDALFFLPVLIFTMLGFELVSGAGGEMKNPKVDVPRAIIVSAIFIGVVYTFAIRSMLVVIPLDNLGLIDGLVDTFRAVFGENGVGGVLTVVFGLLALYSIFTQTFAWAIATARMTAEAGRDGDLPAYFGVMRKGNEAPLGALILTGVVSTTVLLIYGALAANAEDLFWTLFAFSSMLFFMPYAIMFPAFITLRRKDKDIEHPYKFPGNDLVALLFAILCEIIIIAGIIFFVWVPGEPVDWAYAGPILIGLVVTLVLGEILVWWAKKK